MKRLFLALLLAALTSSAAWALTATDSYGRTITYDAAGNYTVTGHDGVELTGQNPGGIEAILTTVNAMPPSSAMAQPPGQ